jgi:hypothetical protein
MPDNDSAAAHPAAGPAWQAAIDFGIDVGQLDFLLTLTPTERLLRHEDALALVRAARQAGIAHYGFDPGLTEAPDRLQG